MDIIPNYQTKFATSAMAATFGSGAYMQLLYLIINIVCYTLPLIMTFINIFSSDMTPLNVDWWLIPATTFSFLSVSAFVAYYSKNDAKKAYFFDWNEYTTGSMVFNPIIACTGYTALLIGFHYFTANLSQALKK